MGLTSYTAVLTLSVEQQNWKFWTPSYIQGLLF
jgi:hypothetical protein